MALLVDAAVALDLSRPTQESSIPVVAAAAKRACRDDPGCVHAWTVHGWALNAMNRPAEALASVDCGLRALSASVFNSEQTSHAEATDEATAEATEAAAVALLQNRGLAHLMTGDWTGAVAAYEHAEQLAPTAKIGRMLERAYQCSAAAALARLTGETYFWKQGEHGPSGEGERAESEAVVTLLCATPAMRGRPWRHASAASDARGAASDASEAASESGSASDTGEAAIESGTASDASEVASESGTASDASEVASESGTASDTSEAESKQRASPTGVDEFGEKASLRPYSSLWGAETSAETSSGDDSDEDAPADQAPTCEAPAKRRSTRNHGRPGRSDDFAPQEDAELFFFGYNEHGCPIGAHRHDGLPTSNLIWAKRSDALTKFTTLGVPVPNTDAGRRKLQNRLNALKKRHAAEGAGFLDWLRASASACGRAHDGGHATSGTGTRWLERKRKRVEDSSAGADDPDPAATSASASGAPVRLELLAPASAPSDARVPREPSPHEEAAADERDDAPRRRSRKRRR